jgi:FkbM family methyltransferase
VNYSQGEEQKHILEHVGETGRFLDIGAWHAKNLSNTRALYERGWGGVLVEPSPEPFLGLLHEYGNDDRIVLVLAAIGDNGLKRFHASADALSTSSEENFKKWQEIGGFYGRYWVQSLEVTFLVDNFGPFDFVSIDTEGTSVEVFRSLLATRSRPRCICLEHDFRNVETLELAKAHGYREVYFSGENQVFAR